MSSLTRRWHYVSLSKRLNFLIGPLYFNVMILTWFTSLYGYVVIWKTKPQILILYHLLINEPAWGSSQNQGLEIECLTGRYLSAPRLHFLIRNTEHFVWPLILQLCFPSQLHSYIGLGKSNVRQPKSGTQSCDQRRRSHFERGARSPVKWTVCHRYSWCLGIASTFSTGS